MPPPPLLLNKQQYVGNKFVKILAWNFKTGLMSVKLADGTLLMNATMNREALLFISTLDETEGVVRDLNNANRFQAVIMEEHSETDDHCGLRIQELKILPTLKPGGLLYKKVNTSDVNSFCRIFWAILIAIAVLLFCLTGCMPSDKVMKSESGVSVEGGADKDYYISGMRYHIFRTSGGYMSVRNITLDSLAFEEYKRREHYRNAGNVYLK